MKSKCWFEMEGFGKIPLRDAVRDLPEDCSCNINCGIDWSPDPILFHNVMAFYNTRTQFTDCQAQIMLAKYRTKVGLGPGDSSDSPDGRGNVVPGDLCNSTCELRIANVSMPYALGTSFLASNIPAGTDLRTIDVVCIDGPIYGAFGILGDPKQYDTIRENSQLLKESADAPRNPPYVR